MMFVCMIFMYKKNDDIFFCNYRYYNKINTKTLEQLTRTLHKMGILVNGKLWWLRRMLRDIHSRNAMLSYTIYCTACVPRIYGNVAPKCFACEHHYEAEGDDAKQKKPHWEYRGCRRNTSLKLTVEWMLNFRHTHPMNRQV
jgi:hypothetical protein